MQHWRRLPEALCSRSLELAPLDQTSGSSWTTSLVLEEEGVVEAR